MIFAAIAPLAVAGDPETAIALAGMLAIMVGLILVGLGIARLGFVADLLSKEVQVGYMNGLAIGVLEGILIAVALSILLFFKRNWWPHGEVLGRVEGEGWHSVSSAPTAEQLPGVLVYRWEAPLYFANSGMFREQIRRLVRAGRPGWVVLQCEAITDIDVTAADMLEQLDIELNAQGVHVAFVELRSRLRDLVSRYGLYETLDRDQFYDSIDEALTAIEAQGDGAAEV